MTAIILSEEQQHALEVIHNFIDGSEPCFTLKGFAGSGKTTLLKYLIGDLAAEGIPYCLCAPTHKAALVMQRATKQKTQTLHSLLALSPNLDIFNLDLANLLFKVSEGKMSIPSKGVVIIDESSMITNDLFDLLLKKCSERESKCLFIGDPAQLDPVKHKETSKAMMSPNQFTLTRIFRQDEDSGLLPVLGKLRESEMKSLPTIKTPKGQILSTHDTAQFVYAAEKFYAKAMHNEDVLFTKILAYTNARVNLYNEVIHQKITREEYTEGEFITAYENVNSQSVSIFNSMDYIIRKVTPCDIDIPMFKSVFGYKLELLDSLTDEIEVVNVLSRTLPDELFTDLAESIEDVRQKAIKANSNYRASYWKNYYSMLDAFVTPKALILQDGRIARNKTLDYGYAITVHKSQGSTYNSILIDWKNINLCKEANIRRQLEYVALSRTKTSAIILQ